MRRPAQVASASDGSSRSRLMSCVFVYAVWRLGIERRPRRRDRAQNWTRGSHQSSLLGARRGHSKGTRPVCFHAGHCSKDICAGRRIVARFRAPRAGGCRAWSGEWFLSLRRGSCVGRHSDDVAAKLSPDDRSVRQIGDHRAFADQSDACERSTIKLFAPRGG